MKIRGIEPFNQIVQVAIDARYELQVVTIEPRGTSVTVSTPNTMYSDSHIKYYELYLSGGNTYIIKEVDTTNGVVIDYEIVIPDKVVVG